MRRTAPFGLTKRDELILITIYYYRYMSARDVAWCLFSPKSKVYVQKLLTLLAGGEDHRENQYLYRFALPSAERGNRERIYTLGTKGRDFLQHEVGMPVAWYFRPEKIKHISYGQLVHNLLLTRFLISASKHPSFKQMKISYELPKAAVIPDAWILFETYGHKFPLLLEIDRGTEYQHKFKDHVAGRMEYLRSGKYEEMFGEKAVTVCYISTGDTPRYRSTRMRTMAKWTMEVLTEQRREQWGNVFRFAAVALDEIYTADLLTEPLWIKPDNPTPSSLFPHREW